MKGANAPYPALDGRPFGLRLRINKVPIERPCFWERPRSCCGETKGRPGVMSSNFDGRRTFAASLEQTDQRDVNGPLPAAKAHAGNCPLRVL